MQDLDELLTKKEKKRELVSIHVRFRWVNYQSIKTKKQKTKERIETSLELVSINFFDR